MTICSSKSFVLAVTVSLLLQPAASPSLAQVTETNDYLLLATSRTSTMQNEMQEAAAQGYVFLGLMGGETSFGGSEVVVIMKRLYTEETARYDYRLMATTKTSTMENELQEAGDSGYVYKGHTVFRTTFGGDEAVVILERDKDQIALSRHEYRLLATNSTATMQKELREAGTEGFEFVGVTVSSTTFGGDEIVVIMKRPVASN
tara:strand:- start:9358 stop:9966 length:609 start_codon:yes stop_codon:yes gene_type:complete